VYRPSGGIRRRRPRLGQRANGGVQADRRTRRALHLRGPGAWLGLTPHVLASLRGPLTAKKLRSQLVRWTVDAVGAGLRRTFGGCQQGRPWRERSCAGHSSRVSVLPRELPFRPVTGNSSVPEGNEVGSETGSVA